MAIIDKGILDWKVIMLDTSIILALFTSEKEGVTDDRVLFTRELIDYLNSSNASDKKPRKFLVSSIVISEILTRENDSEKIKKILRVLDSENVEFVDFDLETSLLFNNQLYPHLGSKTLNKLAESYGFKSHEFMMAREWITRDFMIIMSGASNKADVILTADYKTFYQLANKSDVFCALTYRHLFEKPYKSATNYYHDKAKSQYLIEEAKEVILKEGTPSKKVNLKAISLPNEQEEE
ncbi:hypothetical protein [uncultured Algibacter sp.]|uniref:type II toxin-antitoxin system VapC family toxin n=1 Tax=uncultured Algibacter sp. TaxID=298659 RepID=UPI00263684D1|nr:hypothetical protein [uncultured Algibacter sp.]